MKNAVHTALQGANGYFIIDLKSGSRILVYTTPYLLTKLNFEGVHPQNIEKMTVDLRVVTDYALHISSEMKEGFSLIPIPLGKIGYFERYAE